MIKLDTSVKQKKAWYRKYLDHYQLIMMIIPGLVAFILFAYLPMAGILTAFQDYRIADGILASPWVGFKHFEELFRGRNFLSALRNTFSISFLKLVFGFPMPILFAILLNECVFNKFKKITQTCSYLPHFFSWIILSGIVRQLFSTSGPINTIIVELGTNQPIPFFSNGFWFIFLIIITDIWKEAGWSSVVYLAAISNIDQSLYEAAKIDGANKLQQIRRITIPTLAPTIVTMFILKLSSILNIGMDQIYSLYNPMLYDVADILDTYLLRILQAADYSFGTTVGLFKSVVGLVFVLAGNFVVKKLTDGEQGIL